MSRIGLIILQWRHNGHNGVSNHQPHGCLLNRLFRRRSKKTSKLRVTGLYVGNSPGPVNSQHKGPVTRNMFPFDDVIMTRQETRIFASAMATGKHVLLLVWYFLPREKNVRSLRTRWNRRCGEVMGLWSIDIFIRYFFMIRWILYVLQLITHCHCTYYGHMIVIYDICGLLCYPTWPDRHFYITDRQSDCMFNSVFGIRRKNTSTLCITGPLRWYFLQGPLMSKAISCYDVIMLTFNDTWRREEFS